MARLSHGIAKIGSVKVISFLESIETPVSQVHAGIEIYADVSVT